MSPDLSGAIWKKSRRSGAQGNCVEVADVQGFVAMRNSRDPEGAVLIFSRQEFASFLADVRDGDLVLS